MFDTLIAFFAPHECLGCNQEDALLCEACMRALPEARGCCFRCQRPQAQDRFTACDACSTASPLAGVWATTNYEHLAKDIVWRMKFERARAATKTIARTLQAPPHTHKSIVVAVPTATSRMRRRGYDQAQLIAKHFARRYSLRPVPALARLGQQRQVGASGEQRRQQLQTAFRVTKPVSGSHVILVDDVITSGATLEAAAGALRRAGVKRVDAVVFARA